MIKSSFSLLAIAAFAGTTTTDGNAQTVDSAWKMAPVALATKWAKEVSPTNALREYPRPQMTRGSWSNLNGLWSYGLTDAATPNAPAVMSGQILVPFAYESALSGVGKSSIPSQKLWYKRNFTVPAAWRGQNVILHFGAVNYDSTVTLNGQTLGAHKCGFDSANTTARLAQARGSAIALSDREEL